MNKGSVYLIPTVLAENATASIPSYVLNAVKQCSVFFAENEKTARRYLKLLWKEMVIDHYQWYTIHKAEPEVKQQFLALLKQGHQIGIISEAGCPCIADPGQLLVEAAHQINIPIHPLVGPSSILLALMASGMNGQCFQFHGYLPIEQREKRTAIKTLEADSHKKGCTQIFIETPYRNNQLIQDILHTCREETKLCIAVDITAPSESIRTKTIKEWKHSTPDIHKHPAIFLIQSS